MIHSITLKNFKQHKSYQVGFQPGLNTVQGDNGAGKTTILKAVMFALFGSAAAGNKSHLTTWGESGMRVTVELKLPQIGDVLITRTPSKAEITKGDELLASGQTAVTSFVEDQLGMPAKLFKSMLYAEQGDTQALLKMGAAELQKQLETVANIGVIDKVLDLISSDNKLHQGALDGIGQTGNIKEISTEVDLIEKAYEKQNTLFGELSAQVAKLSSSLDDARSNHQTELNNLLRVTDLDTKIEVCQSQLKNAQLSVADSEDNKPGEVLAIDITTLQEATGALKDKLVSKRRALMSYQSDLAAYQNDAKERQRLTGWKPVIEEASKLFDKVKAESSKLNTASSELNAALKSEAGSICPACERPFENHEQMAAMKVSAQKKYDKAKEKVEIARTAFREYLLVQGLTEAEFERTVNAINFIQTRNAVEEPVPLDFIEEDLLNLEAEISANLVDIQSMNRGLKDFQDWVIKADRLRLTAQKIENDLLGLQATRSRAPEASRDKVDQYQEEINTLEQQHKDALKNTTDCRELYVKLGHDLSTARKDLDLARSKQERIDRINLEIAKATDLQKYLRTNRAKFMTDSWAALTNYTSALLGSVTDGLITDLTRDDSGTFFVNEGGMQVPVEELSGARKSMVGLCLRISLAHLFYGDNSFILLDEVTADCSEGNSARIAGMLRSLQSQVIMVTHRQSDALNANNAIYLG